MCRSGRYMQPGKKSNYFTAAKPKVWIAILAIRQNKIEGLTMDKGPQSCLAVAEAVLLVTSS